MGSHTLNSLEKLEEHKIILKIQDTTELNYSSHKSTKGLGYNSSKSTGLMVHTTMAVTDTGIPAGILLQKIWSRDNSEKGKAKDRRKKKIEEKESFKWLESLQKTESMFLNTQLQVMIADRESDIFEVMSAPRIKNSHFLIRASQDRIVEHTEHTLFAALETLPVNGYLNLDVKRSKEREERVANLAVKYHKLTVKGPLNSKLKSSEIEINVIVVKELEPPENVEPIEWILLTSLEINSLDDALKYVQWYSYRWLIERFHYTLKSGCQIENLELETAERLSNALSIYSIVAINLLNITYQARKEPEASSEKIFSKREWQTLYIFVHKNDNIPPQAPKLKEVVLWIAKLGGFLARKSDGEPGIKVLWRGYQTFVNMLEAINTFSSLKFLSVN